MPDEPIGDSQFAIRQLIRPDITTMEEYTPVQPFEVLSRRLGRAPEAIVKLDANENPYGPAPRVVEALSRFPWYHIYPDPQQEALREALSGYTGVSPEHILPGHGADELLDYLCRLFLVPGNTGVPGDAVINCPPTFGMYSFDARLSGGTVIDVPRREDFSLDVAAIKTAVLASHPTPKLLFLASPNNPDGGLISHDTLRRLLKLPIVVVVDEAYVEFATGDVSVAAWVPSTPNLVVLRTFSKWAGLAGLRLGYGIFPIDIIQHLWKFKQPYNVNVAATVAGLASLEDRPLLQQRVGRLVAERERMREGLAKFSFLRPLPSQANFLLCETMCVPARQIQRALAEQGVLVRYYDKPGLRNYIRISAGRPGDTDALFQALTELGIE